MEEEILMQQEEREQHLALSPKQVPGPGLPPFTPAQALMIRPSSTSVHGAITASSVLVHAENHGGD